MTAKTLMKRVAKRFSDILGDSLTGVYVHGSLAFGCCNAGSDIDFIAVTERPLSPDEKIQLITALAELSEYAPEKGFEMSVVLRSDCVNFIYPTPFQLHYSEAYREDVAKDISGFCEKLNGTDHDLAAHFTVLREVGYSVCGAELSEVFGEVPREYYLDSIMRDISGAAEDIEYNPVYYILNLCRVMGYLESGKVMSKKQGAMWAKKHLPPVLADMAATARECYLSGEPFPQDEDIPLGFFAEYMLDKIREKTGG